MVTVDNKENVAPFTSSDPLHSKADNPSPKRAARKGRSKSIGPGGLEAPEESKQDAKEDAKNRRKSTYVPTTKSIISTDIEKAERQAARRKTLANRRVSFAPEATLHTWDVVEFMRDPTTSTDSSENTRRTSKGSPFKRSPSVDSDPPSDPDDDEDEPAGLPVSPAQAKNRRRSSGIPSTTFSDPDETSSAISDTSESEDGEEDAEGSEDDTGTAMSIDVENNTAQSIATSEASSTDSSARLEASLRAAAQAAGTRGIEYDEYGDASMEIAGEEVTNALKPWAEQLGTEEPANSAALDQENINPFSPAFKAQLISGTISHPETIVEEDTGDLSMDMTRAVGGVVKQPAVQAASSPMGDGTMDLTRAVGSIQQPQSPQTRSGQKRRRSTTDMGSPGAALSVSQSKRRRSSAARSSMGDDTMDLTVAMGGIQSAAPPAKSNHRKSATKRRSSGAVSEQEEATMEFTQAVGGVKSTTRTENTASSFDENEELTMELTTVLGGIKAAEKAAEEVQPATPQNMSPVKDALNTTPKDQERFKDAPDSGAKKLLTPIFQKQILQSAEKASSSKSKKLASPAAHTRASVPFAEEEKRSIPGTPLVSPVKEAEPHIVIPSLGDHRSPLKETPTQSAARRSTTATPDSTLKQQLDAQLQAQQPSAEPSPSVQKQQRSSPVKPPATPDKVDEPTQDGRRLAESIKLMSTPRKETLKNATPKKQAQPSPQAAPTSRTRPTPRGRPAVNTSPARQLSEDLTRIQSEVQPSEKIALQSFLDMAGIRFMDLQATKRRMTHTTTPSKAKKAGEAQAIPDESTEVDLESAIRAGATTLPELEMYEHACHELKRYISEGKRVVKDLEAETAKVTPPLLQAYMVAGGKRKSVMDSQMREIKVQARGRSREMWYAWRTQLLGDLMRGLRGVGEGLGRDEAVLERAEEVLEGVLPSLVEQQEMLQVEAERLELAAGDMNEDEKEELDAARERLCTVEVEMEEKMKILQELKREMEEQQSQANDLEESKEEFGAAIREADRVKESCRSVSIDEITELKESLDSLEETYNYRLLSASSSPATVTLSYKHQLQLFFHPAAFSTTNSTNKPISLTYTSTEQQGTTLRFFLQLLRASLQALPQSSTRVADLLSLVSNGWDAALAVAEAERRLNLETLTEARIVSDERLAIVSTILLPKIRSKVRVTFDVAAAVGGGEGEGLELSTTVEPRVEVVYGEQYDEGKMTEFVRKAVAADGDDGFEGWGDSVRELRERLVVKGAKATKK